MNYPLISEYIEAIKASEDNFEQLNYLRPILDEDGEPVMSSGNFAVVFKMKDLQTGKLHAVKCFLKEQEGRAEAYRMIAEELEYVSSTFLTPIKYMDKELFVDTNASDETEFPVLLMDWVEGQTLDKYILQIKYDGYRLVCLSRNFYELSKWLLSQSFAHGDLKPDNIIVTNDDNLVLIDYDGMYVPKMQGQKPREKGSPNYRIPYHDNSFLKNYFSKKIDDFAIIHMLLSLRVYSSLPHLISKDKDFALFCYDEFHNINETTIYKEILSSKIDVQTSLLLMLFQKLIVGGDISREEWQLIEFKERQKQYVNMEELICNLDNIVLAVNLAYSSMLYKDPARNEVSLNQYRDVNDRVGLAIEIQNDIKKHNINNYSFPFIKYTCLRPNGKEYREGVALDLYHYALRYLFGIVKYVGTGKKNPQSVFGGGKDVFTPNIDDKKYETYLDEFVHIQESYVKKYRYLYVFDIRNFFSSIDISKMKDIYFGNDFSNVEWYEELYSWILHNCSEHGLNPCCEVDFYFANLYLNSLDEEMMCYEGIEYFRYCDDIRIFSNDDSLVDVLNEKISSVLSPLSLRVNTEKTKIIDTNKEKIELAKACFIWSCRIYYGKNDNQSVLLDGKTLTQIIENDLTTTYIFKLLQDVNGRAIMANESLYTHIDNLLYILRHVHKNATLYRIVSELLFDIGVDNQEDLMLFSYILENIVAIFNDEEVEPFVKYWILRTFFCTDKRYYELYRNEETKWKDQTWYPKPCYMKQITNILDRKFRKMGYNPLLYHISHYILSVIKPNYPEPIESHTDDLPF